MFGRLFSRGAAAASRTLALSRLQSSNVTATLVSPASRLLSTSPALGSGTKVIPYLLADIGEGIAEAKLIEWHVEVGDYVNQFDPICNMASDKANVDISSRYDGYVRKLYYEEDEMAIVGKPFVDIEVAIESIDDEDTDSSAAADASGAAETPSAPSASAQSPTEDEPKSNKKVLMTPAVRRIVSENNIPIEKVVGTGKDGRVLKEDVLKFMQEGPQTPAVAATKDPSPFPTTPSAAAPAAASVPGTIQRGLTADETFPVTGIKAAMVKSMTAALKVPHFSYADEIEVDALIEAKNMLAPTAAAQGIKLTYMPFLIKAASVALEQYPVLNSHVAEDASSYTMKASHNIGVAMDTPAGLIVPNVKSCNTKSVLEIARDLNELQTLGKEGKLGTSHLTGGTFTLSNIGVLGGTYLGPVVVVPEVAIGALGRFRRVPKFDANDNVVPANIMELSFSADHRIIDGVTIAKFSNVFKDLIENPIHFLASLK